MPPPAGISMRAAYDGGTRKPSVAAPWAFFRSPRTARPPNGSNGFGGSGPRLHGSGIGWNSGPGEYQHWGCGSYGSGGTMNVSAFHHEKWPAVARRASPLG